MQATWRKCRNESISLAAHAFGLFHAVLHGHNSKISILQSSNCFWFHFRRLLVRSLPGQYPFVSIGISASQHYEKPFESTSQLSIFNGSCKNSWFGCQFMQVKKAKIILCFLVSSDHCQYTWNVDLTDWPLILTWMRIVKCSFFPQTGNNRLNLWMLLQQVALLEFST